jgi:hypothetical protein
MVEALICFDTARRRDAKGRKVVDPLKSIELSHLGDVLPVYITSATPAQCTIGSWHVLWQHANPILGIFWVVWR